MLFFMVWMVRVSDLRLKIQIEQLLHSFHPWVTTWWSSSGKPWISLTSIMWLFSLLFPTLESTCSDIASFHFLNLNHPIKIIQYIFTLSCLSYKSYKYLEFSIWMCIMYFTYLIFSYNIQFYGQSMLQKNMYMPFF